MTRILCCDVRLIGHSHADWKEGYELAYAFRALGHTCHIAGPNSPQFSECNIPDIANDYDLIVVTENYPAHSEWEWWDWASIRTPKVFWAIDTHILTFPWLSDFDWIAYNIRDHVRPPNGFWLPYGLSEIHQRDTNSYPKIYDTVFIGSLQVSPKRKELCERFNIQHLQAYGADYIRAMKLSKICFNHSISGEINAKYFDIMGSGTFMITNYNQDLIDLFNGSPDLIACMYKTDDEVGEKIKYYLEHEEEREAIARRLNEYVWNHHTWKERCKVILENCCA